VFGIKFRHELPEGFKRAFGTGMIPTILINLFIGYSLPFIDNAAHLGGFVAGALFALFVGYERPGERAGMAVFWRVLQFAALSLVVVAFGQVARHMGAAGANTSIESHVKAMNAGQEAFRAAFNRRDVEAANRAISQIDRAPALDPQPDGFRLELKQLLVRARDLALLNETERKSERVQEQLKQLAVDFDAWEKRSDNWVKTEGEKYGIRLETEEVAPSGSPAPAAPAPTASTTPSPPSQ
jgi:hypothetical protein